MDARKSDVLVIGGGVIGLSCAYFLQRAGRSVRILEKSTLGSGSSSGNCGLITPSHAEPVPAPGVPQQAMKWMFDKSAPLSVKPRLDTEFLSWGSRFLRYCTEEAAEHALKSKSEILRASRVLTGKLVAAESLNCQWSEAGMIAVCLEQDTLNHLREFAQKASQYNVPCKVLDRVTLHETEPSLREEVLGGVLFSQDAIVRPEMYVAELIRVVKDRGVALEEDAEVKALNVEEGKVHSAFTSRGLYEADQFVLAGGAWSSALVNALGLDLPVEPGKGYSLSSNLLPDPCPKHALLLEERSIAVTPWANGFRIGGTMEFAGFDNKLNKARLDALLVGAEEYLLEPMPPGPPRKWCGFRPMTPDDLPYIGPSPKHPNLTLATGHNMLGMSMSASTGRLVTEMIAGRDPHVDPTPYDPGRFMGNQGHWFNKFRRWRWSRR